MQDSREMLASEELRSLVRRRWTVGATAYRGNDTLGSLPAVREVTSVMRVEQSEPAATLSG